MWFWKVNGIFSFCSYSGIIWSLCWTNISFFLSSVYTDELLSTPKIITFLPQSKPEYEKCEQESNPIPYPE